MEQKIIWMRYLIIGSSASLLFLIASCGEGASDPRLDVDIIYINETNHNLKYYQYIPAQEISRFFVFEIPPNSQELMEFRGIGGSANNLTAENCCEGYFEGYQGRNNAVLVEFDEEKCLVYPSGQGSTTQNISSYEGKQLEKRYFEFTYRFTKGDYEAAVDCE